MRDKQELIAIRASMSSSITCSHFSLLLLLLLLLPIFAVCQGYRNITLGSSLNAGSDEAPWTSPSGDFAFGFRPLDENKTTFLVSIWFDKIPEKTVVWYAAANKTTEKGSKVELSTDGKLVLEDPQGNELWMAALVNGAAATYAAMLDNGNFILAGENSSSSDNYVWQSFENPTDTILPTQTLKVNEVLYSRQTTKTFSKGRFRLRLGNDGNMTLYAVAFPSLTENNYIPYYITYYAIQRILVLPKTKNPTYQLIFNETGYIYIVEGNQIIYSLSQDNIVPNNDVYYRATLDFDGVFTQYSYPRTSTGNWSVVWSIPENICQSIITSALGSGPCGYNSYCSLSDEKSERRHSCFCPPGYSYLDPNNIYNGCRPNFEQGCQEENIEKDLYELKILQDVDWPLADYEVLNDYTEEECKSSCLDDCLCAAAIARSATCYKKKLPLSNGKFIRDLDGKALIKVRKNESNIDIHQSSSSNKEDKSTLIVVVSVLLGSSVFFNFIFLAVISVLFVFMKRKFNRTNQNPSILRSNLRSFTYQALVEATDGFKEELGRGAFGIVYKGIIEEMGTSTIVAVKKLDKVIREGEKEFKAEVTAIGQSHHKNLVRLLGFCEDGQNRLLVYEFMSNGSLAEHLFGISKPDWNQRVHIAFGIARGLMYLHEECITQIIHCDIKPQNILLDDNFTARISDFGLAKLLMHEQTRTSTGIRGTRGYVAPEWFRNTPVSAKVDVYSFGVLLLEIICCRKGVDLLAGEEDIKAILTDWVYFCYSKGKLEDLVEFEEDVVNDMKRFERLVMIAIWCIQEEPTLRPSMKKVVHMLEGVVEVSEPPFLYPSDSFCEM